MAVSDLSDWLGDFCASHIALFVKRLSGNDTLANGTHQAGPYIPKEFLFRIFPTINRTDAKNPDRWFELAVDSDSDVRQVRAVYYNSKRFEGKQNGRDETRLTNFGGAASALLDAESTEPAKIPAAWLTQFPTGAEIVHKTVELRPEHGTPPDKRLLRRRECEFEIFRSVEEAVEFPAIRAGFTTLDDFISRAQSVLQRRKARSGRSLELHIREILIEERFREGTDFQHGPQSEPGKRPDFLFPSQAAYRDPNFPASGLRMLATKTTCRDRWRQVINEADRISVKHLLTLQEGVSEAQFREMTQANVQLVVPEPLIDKFPTSIRTDIVTLESFLGDLRLLVPGAH